MKKLNKQTKTFKLLDAMRQGERVTPAQAEKRFGIKNIRAEVTRIRQAGFAVYTKHRVAANHRPVTEYVIGEPSREIVAAGYRALRAGL